MPDLRVSESHWQELLVSTSRLGRTPSHIMIFQISGLLVSQKPLNSENFLAILYKPDSSAVVGISRLNIGVTLNECLIDRYMIPKAFHYSMVKSLWHHFTYCS